MPKTIFRGPHSKLVEMLVRARHRAGLKQAEVAARIERDQSHISLIEGGQRRIDVIEFIALARALDQDPRELFSELLDQIDRKSPHPS